MIIDQELVGIIGTVGFPIAICAYLLYERKTTTKDLISAIRDLTIVIKTRLEDLKHGH